VVRGVERGELATSWTGGVLMVSAIQSQLGDWEVLDVDNALGGVWHVFTRSKHRWLPWKKMVGTGSIKVITCPVHIESRISATVSNFREKMRSELRLWNEQTDHSHPRTRRRHTSHHRASQEHEYG